MGINDTTSQISELQGILNTLTLKLREVRRGHGVEAGSRVERNLIEVDSSLTNAQYFVSQALKGE